MTQPEIAPQTSEVESTPQPLGHLASQEQEEQNNYTKPVCSLDKHRKLLVQSRSKHILHHWSIPRWDLSSTHLKRNWKKNENKGKERKKKRNDSCHFCLLAGFYSCLTCFARAEGWSPQKWIVFIINVIKDYPHNNGSLSKKPLAMLTRTVR